MYSGAAQTEIEEDIVTNGGGGVLEHPQKWSCCICTFRNAAGTCNCEMCGTRAPTHFLAASGEGCEDIDIANEVEEDIVAFAPEERTFASTWPVTRSNWWLVMASTADQ